MSAEPLSVDAFTECTTRARAKRHWSLNPTMQWGLSPLCDTTATGYGQAWIDQAMPEGWRKRKVIADLPLCKQCEKSRNRRMEGRSA